MTLSTVIANAHDPIQLLCGVDEGVKGWLMVTIFVCTALVIFFGTFVWKRDLYISGSATSVVLFFMAVTANLIRCDTGYILINTDTLIIIFVILAVFVTFVRAGQRNEN